ncbi:MAG: hypothetical protein IRY94_06725 [Rhodospirillaceae bacterium]|nr:hypothetical protein [Rhodospirillaceae bacterium]
MFGPPSLSKFLVLVLIVAIVWGAFRLLGRLQAAREEEARRMARQARAKVAKAEDMVLCRSCGAYYAASVHHECAPGGGRG